MPQPTPTAPAPARLDRFRRDESGAVTLDWVALTAAMVFLGAAAGFFATSEVPRLAGKVDSSLDSMPVMPD